MPEGPYNTVKDGIKVLFLKWKKSTEVKFHQRLQEAEKVGSNFRERVEITGDER
jgi:hypothetical protein